MSGRSSGATEAQRLLYLSVLLIESGPRERLPEVVEESRRWRATWRRWAWNISVLQRHFPNRHLRLKAVGNWSLTP